MCTVYGSVCMCVMDACRCVLFIRAVHAGAYCVAVHVCVCMQGCTVYGSMCMCVQI